MTTCLNGELFFQVSAVSRCSLDCLNMQPTCNIGMQVPPAESNAKLNKLDVFNPSAAHLQCS